MGRTNHGDPRSRSRWGCSPCIQSRTPRSTARTNSSRRIRARPLPAQWRRVVTDCCERSGRSARRRQRRELDACACRHPGGSAARWCASRSRYSAASSLRRLVEVQGAGARACSASSITQSRMPATHWSACRLEAQRQQRELARPVGEGATNPLPVTMSIDRAAASMATSTADSGRCRPACTAMADSRPLSRSRRTRQIRSRRSRARPRRSARCLDVRIPTRSAAHQFPRAPPPSRRGLFDSRAVRPS